MEENEETMEENSNVVPQHQDQEIENASNLNYLKKKFRQCQNCPFRAMYGRHIENHEKGHTREMRRNFVMCPVSGCKFISGHKRGATHHRKVHSDEYKTYLLN